MVVAGQFLIKGGRKKLHMQHGKAGKRACETHDEEFLRCHKGKEVRV